MKRIFIYLFAGFLIYSSCYAERYISIDKDNVTYFSNKAKSPELISIEEYLKLMVEEPPFNISWKMTPDDAEKFFNQYIFVNKKQKRFGISSDSFSTYDKSFFTRSCFIFVNNVLDGFQIYHVINIENKARDIFFLYLKQLSKKYHIINFYDKENSLEAIFLDNNKKRISLTIGFEMSYLKNNTKIWLVYDSPYQQ